MTEPNDETIQRIVEAALADPAVQAAADQLHAAAGQPIDQAQEDGLAVILRTIARHAIDQLGIPPEAVPAVMEAAARYWENEYGSHDKPGSPDDD